MTGSTLAVLASCRVLVVEDEYMIAMEIARTLRAAGAEAIGPVPDVADALTLVGQDRSLDAALLDVNLRGKPVWPLVDVLLARGVPLVLTTGYEAHAIPTEYAHLPRVEKPVSEGELTRSLARVLAARVPE